MLAVLSMKLSVRAPVDLMARAGLPFAPSRGRVKTGLLAIAMASVAACGGASPDGESAGSSSLATSATNVQLIAAEVVSELGSACNGTDCPSFGFDSRLVARVQVAGATSQQQVFVEYRVTTMSGATVQDWTRAPGAQASGNDWQIESPLYVGQCTDYCNELLFQFAVGNTVNGQTYWDNNGGWNYQVSSDVQPVPGGVAPAALLGNSHVMLADTTWSANGTTWSGHVLVDNLAYAKMVSIVYSTDGWKTTLTAPASYYQATIDSQEYWKFAVTMPPHATGVDFAVSYAVGGHTYWDNNLSTNYHVRAPALVFYETFDSQSALLHPAVGPAGTLRGAATLVDGTHGQAYYGDTATSGALAYPGTVLPADRGAIEFDARLYTPPTDIPIHDSPWFFLAPVGDYSQYALGFNGNDGWGGGGLEGWTAHGDMATGCFADTYTYAGLLGGADKTQTWHHYLMAWDKDGLPGLTETMQVYLDGQPVGTTSFCNEDHAPTAFPQPTGQLFVGYIQDNFGGSAFAIDELKIWSYAKTN